MSVHGIDVGHARGLLRAMLRIRRFEERCAELYSAGEIRGFLHLYNGEEAVAVGAMEALGPDDRIVATYREHGQALARGVPMGALLAELLGRATGPSRGRGGSMHVFDASRGFLGGNAIVAAGLPVAVGLGLGDRMRGREAITACFFGDGAVAEGAFHEAMNLAALWRLPVLFLCENNGYAMGTALELAEAETDLRRKAESYRMPAEAVDGMDVLAVEAAAGRAADAVRRGEGPYFLELRTYRFRAHSMYDPELYRARGEVDAWRARDPIEALAARLAALGAFGSDDRAALEDEVRTEIDAAYAEAAAAPVEPVDDLLRDVEAVR